MDRHDIERLLKRLVDASQRLARQHASIKSLALAARYYAEFRQQYGEIVDAFEQALAEERRLAYRQGRESVLGDLEHDDA